MTEIILSENAVQTVEEAIANDKLTNSEEYRCDKNGRINLLRTIVKGNTGPCTVNTLSKEVIFKLMFEFSNLRTDRINEYARRFAEVASKPVHYEYCLCTAKRYDMTFIDALEWVIQLKEQKHD